MSLIPFGFWAASGSGGLSYWLSTIGSDEYEQTQAVARDSLDNSYLVGWYQVTSGTRDGVLIKRDPEGAVLWQRNLDGTEGDQFYGVDTDSSDNVYITGFSGDGVLRRIVLIKYNSSGTLQWQKLLGNTSSGQNGRAVAITTSDDIYVTGDVFGVSSTLLLLAKYNSSGTLQWQRTLGYDDANSVGHSVAFDSSGNVYVAGQTGFATAGGEDILVAKYNSSGTLQWQRILGSSANQIAYGIATDAAGNSYVTGYASLATFEIFIAKYNSSGTLQWQRTFGGSDFEFGFGVALDSLENVYVATDVRSSPLGGRNAGLMKYDSSGTLQWQREIRGSGTDVGKAVTIDSLDNIYFAGETNSTGEGSYDFMLCKLPSDGSKTGTYTLDAISIIYEASSLTSSTSTMTDAASTLSEATSSFSATTASLTSSAASLVSHIVIL